MAQKLEMQDFTVSGTKGKFPFDMLRYDACWPASERDSALIAMTSDEQEYLKRRTITLRTYTRHLTPGRWSSFTWTIEAWRQAPNR